MAPSRLHQRQRMHRAAPRCGQPRPTDPMGRVSSEVGRPYWPCFPPAIGTSRSSPSRRRKSTP
eukprot:scaffold6508_cov45-Phaeocystis_antarctica.AAC.1